MAAAKKHAFGKDRFELMDWILIIILTIWMLCILIPFFNVIAISFTSYKEYMQSTWVLWPKEPVLDAYEELFKDNRIFVGYKTTLCYLAVGVPLNLVLCSTLAYALCRKGWPGRHLIFMLILFTMIFNGGIVPLYLVMKDLGLTNTIWAVILAQGMNTFNMILIYNYFCSLPEALMESANLDGADEWTILVKIVLPLSKAVIAVITLYYAVYHWNAYFEAFLYLTRKELYPLQLILRQILLENTITADTVLEADMAVNYNLVETMKYAVILVACVPIWCVYPFVQKYFVQGVMIGAIKG